MWAKHVIRDAFTIRSQQMPKKEKLYWLYYSVVRNYGRYYGGYKGGMWHTYSEKKKALIDKKYSQQYKQRKA